jgi:hypothetical protein
VTADAFGNLWGMRVFNEEMYIHFIGEVFLTSFLRIFRGYIFDCTCALADQSIWRDRIQTLLSLPRLALRVEKFQESRPSLCT